MTDKDNPKKPQTIFLTIGSKQAKERKELGSRELQTGKTESAAAIEPKKEDEEFQWMFPDEADQKADVLEQYAPVKTTTAKRVSGKLLVIAASAVLIGVLLGYALVQVVTQKDEAPPQAVLKEQKAEKEEGAAAPAAPSSPSAETKPLPPIETAVVQGGIFSTKTAADSVKQQMKGVGMPAEIVRQNGQYVVLLAASSAVETAKLVGSVYAADGAATYAKQFSISPSDSLPKAAGDMAVPFLLIAEESAKKAAGLSIDQSKLAKAEKELAAVEVHSKDKDSGKMKQLLTDALTEAKSDQPQAAQAAQKKLLAFLAAYSQ